MTILLYRLCYIMLLLLAVVPLQAQDQPLQLTGIVRNTGGLPLSGANVTLILQQDTAVKSLAITDSTGRFSITDILPGTYTLSVFFLGHAPYVSPPFSMTSGVVEKNNIRLTEINTTLQGITLLSKRKLMERGIGKTTVNMNELITSEGSNALEALEKIPGVALDKDGNISVRGKQGVIVMIDGTPNYVTGSALISMLRGMNASQITAVDVITSPGAQYDAAGTAGIINIKTKKNSNAGFNGTFTTGYTQGRYWRTANSLMLNYRAKKINTFLNYNYNNSNGYTNLNLERTYTDKSGNIINRYEQGAYLTSGRQSNVLKLGMDYFLSDKTTLGIVATGMLAPSRTGNISSGYFSSAGAPDSSAATTAKTRQKWRNGTIGISFKQQLDSASELTVNLDYLHYDINQFQHFVNLSFDKDSLLQQQEQLRGTLPVSIRIYAGKADYTRQLPANWKLNTGIKYSMVKTDNIAAYDVRENNGPEKPDYGKSNHFLYEENIQAAYVTAIRELEKWKFEAGLRFENTRYKGHQLGNPEKRDSAYSRQYNNLFPVLQIGFTPNENHEFGFSLGRRINRPPYQDLNPFLFFVNKYTYEQGNPFLRPEYAYNMELSHSYKGKLTTTLNYSHTTDYFTQFFRSVDNVTILGNYNLANMYNAGINISAQLDVTSWWSVLLSGDLNYKKIVSSVADNVNASVLLAQINSTNKFTLSKTLSAEITGFYNSKDIDGQFTTRGLGQVSAGISKQLWQNKGTIRLNVRDIFYTQTLHGIIDYNNVKEQFTQSFDARSVNISFSYRFGGSSKPPAPVKESDLEEKNRVKGL